MAIIHMDSFDHYGADVTQMSRGSYIEASGINLALSTTRARTGPRALFFDVGATLRYALPVAQPIAGVGMVMWFDSLPTVGDLIRPFSFRDHTNKEHIRVMVQTTGALEVWRGDNFVSNLGSSAPVLTTGAWQHLEARCKVHASAGEVEIRVNGVTVLALTGIDTTSSLAAADEIAQAAFYCTVAGAASAACYVDDFYIWDTTGPANVDFIGDRRVLTDFPIQDTVIADWGKSSGVNGFALINESPPDDGGTYIYSPVFVAPGDRSAFQFTPLSPEVAAVASVMVVNRSIKTDAGPCSTRVSVISGAVEGLGVSNAITGVYTDRADRFDLDPATGAPWTPAAINASLIAIRRTL